MSTSLKQDALTLRKKKRLSAEVNKKAKALTADFKSYQARFLARMERDEVEQIKVDGTLFSPVRDKVYAKIEDRSEFVRWAMNESDAIGNFIYERCKEDEDFDDSGFAEHLQALIQAIAETPFIQLKEHSDPLNALVRERLDDGQILPPGVGFRTDDYISQRSG